MTCIYVVEPEANRLHTYVWIDFSLSSEHSSSSPTSSHMMSLYT